MTKSNTAPVAFTRKNAAAMYLAATAKGRADVHARIKAQAAKNQKRAWKTLVRYIETADLVRIKLVVSGTREDWAAINADAKAAKAAPKPKAAPKAKAKAKAKAPVAKAPAFTEGVDAVAAAKAYAALIGAGLGASPEAALIASFLRG